jgi:hypothetical protein
MMMMIINCFFEDIFLNFATLTIIIVISVITAITQCYLCIGDEECACVRFGGEELVFTFAYPPDDLL